MEAQAHQGLSLPKEGKPFLDYPNETRRGQSYEVSGSIRPSGRISELMTTFCDRVY
jgi:hypothetical protein